ncbi:MAG: hypothetical protein AB7N99_05385 [Simkaniaceae bacterium]
MSPPVFKNLLDSSTGDPEKKSEIFFIAFEKIEFSDGVSFFALKVEYK